MIRKTELHTPRLVLKPLATEHSEAIAALLEDGRVAKTVSNIPFPYTIADAEWFVSHVSGEEAPSIVRAIIRRSDGTIIGCIGVEPKGDDEAEFGYWLGEAYWGEGYATEAAQVIVADAMDRLGMREVRAAVYPRNPASRRVLLKCGLQPAPEGAYPETIQTIRGAIEALEWFVLRRDG